MTVTITLETMRFHANHGVNVEERTIGGAFLVDISCMIDTHAVETDCIYDTIDYVVLYDLVKQEISKPSSTIEHVAGRVMRAIKAQHQKIQAIEVKISKLNPPVDGEIASASVTIKA